MLKNLVRKTIAVGAVTLLSTHAFAGLILETYSSGAETPDTIGGYAMTDFAVTNGTGNTSTSTVASPISGNVTFAGQGGAAIALTENRANSVGWWNNGEAGNRDYDIYTTNVSWIEIFLPENTRAFSFNVGANLSSGSNNAWLVANEINGGAGVSKSRFNVSTTNTPGFGIYADSSNNSCSAITSVIIDPDYWGIGNFSINQSECATVPEPSSISLLALSLLGLGALRKKRS